MPPDAVRRHHHLLLDRIKRDWCASTPSLLSRVRAATRLWLLIKEDLRVAACCALEGPCLASDS